MKYNIKERNNIQKRGFTLIELIASIAIISIIAVLAINRYQGVVLSGQEAKQKAVINAVESAKEQFVADEKTTNSRVVSYNRSTSASTQLKSYLGEYLIINGGSATLSTLLEGTGKTVIDLGKCKAMASGTIAATESTPASFQ